MPGDDAVDLDAADVGVLDVAAPGEHGANPGPERSHRRAVLAAAVGVAALLVVVASGVLHHRAATPAPLATDPTSIDVQRVQRAVDAAARAKDGVRVDWGGLVIGLQTDSGAATDVERSGTLRGATGSAVNTGAQGATPDDQVHLGYRVITRLIPGTSSHPCLLPTVRIDQWQFDQGGDPSLGCRPTTGPAAGSWALRQGRASLSGGRTIVVREVVLARGTRVNAVATWSIGEHPAALTSAAQLRRVARALADTP